MPLFRRLLLAPSPVRRTSAPSGRFRRSGQSIAEFAIIVPVVFLILLGIADLGRVYTSAVAVEAAAREAADFGAFSTTNWDASSPSNIDTTVTEMKRRACVAAKGSHLEGYAQSDPGDDTTCTNPTFTCTLERGGVSTDCSASGGFVGGADCSLPVQAASGPVTDPPCTVHVHLGYDFRTFFAIPPMPESIGLGRDSFFRIASLDVAP